jgi:hypothetical protein
MKFLAMIAVLASGLGGRPASADVLWTVSADTSASVGAETRAVYRPSLPAGAKLEPDALASATTSFAVVKTEAGTDGTWTWTLLPLDEGALEFVARWKLDGKDAAAPPVRIAARAPGIAKDADIDDIKGPLTARRVWWPWLLAALLGAAAWEAWRRWWKSRPQKDWNLKPEEPKLPPEVVAERALDELAASKIWERGGHDVFYLRLTEILRAYLEARYAEPALAMTSIEVARLVKSKEPDLKTSAIVRELLQRADLVKFARIKAGADDGPNDAAQVLAVVRTTTPGGGAAPAEAPR